MRLADAFRSAADEGACDEDFLLTCSCGLEQRVDALELDDGDDLVLYDCPRCANSIVAVLPNNAATELWLSTTALTGGQQEVGVHRRNGLVFGARVDVAWQPPGDDEPRALIPAAPHFMAALRYF